MFEVAPSPLSARQHIEAELLEEVRRTQQAWRDAPEEERDRARRRFMEALHLFNSVPLYGTEPFGA